VTATDPRLRKLLALLYLAGALIAIDQIADLIATLLANPVSLGAVQWRFGAFGLAATRGSVLLVAEIMLFAAALGLEHPGVLRFLGVLNLVLAVVLVAWLGLFALDTLQVRSAVDPGAPRARYTTAAARAGSIAVLLVLLLGWSGIAVLRMPRYPKRQGKGRGSILIEGHSVKEVPR
jgi:hypothetical protein